MGKKTRAKRAAQEQARDTAHDFAAALENFSKSKTTKKDQTAAEWLDQVFKVWSKADRACHAYISAKNPGGAVEVYESVLKELDELRALCQSRARDFSLLEATCLNNAGASHFEVFRACSASNSKEADMRKAYDSQKAVSSHYGRAASIYRELGEKEKLFTQLERQVDALHQMSLFVHEAVEALREIKSMKAANPSFTTTFDSDEMLWMCEKQDKLHQEQIEQAGGREAFMEECFTSTGGCRAMWFTESSWARAKESVREAGEAGTLLVETEFAVVVLWESSGLAGPVLHFPKFIQANSLKATSSILSGSSEGMWDLWHVVSEICDSPFPITPASRDDTLFVLILHRQRSSPDNTTATQADWNLCLHKHCISGHKLLTARDGVDGCSLAGGLLTVPCDPSRLRHRVAFGISPEAITDIGAQVIAAINFTWDNALISTSGRISGSSQVGPVAALRLLGVGRDGAVRRICGMDATPRCAECGAREERLGDKLSKCSACRVVAYCNAACQKQHWRQHKVECQRLKEEKDQERVLGQREPARQQQGCAEGGSESERDTGGKEKERAKPQRRRDVPVEAKASHLQPFVTVLDNLLTNARPNATASLRETAEFLDSLREACTQCDQRAVSGHVLVQATGVDGWSLEEQATVPCMGGGGDLDDPDGRLARFGCRMSFKSLWGCEEPHRGYRLFQFQRVFATPQQALAYFRDPEAVAWEAEMTDGMHEEVSERCAWARSPALNNNEPASANTTSERNGSASANTNTPAFQCRVFRARPAVMEMMVGHGFPAGMSSVCALVVRGDVFCKLYLSLCSGTYGDGEGSMRQLVHFVVR